MSLTCELAPSIQGRSIPTVSPQSRRVLDPEFYPSSGYLPPANWSLNTKTGTLAVSACRFLDDWLTLCAEMGLDVLFFSKLSQPNPNLPLSFSLQYPDQTTTALNPLPSNCVLHSSLATPPLCFLHFGLSVLLSRLVPSQSRYCEGTNSFDGPIASIICSAGRRLSQFSTRIPRVSASIV